MNTGIDGSDLMPSVARHNLKENKEYLNMLEEMKKKSDDYFDLLNDDVAEQLRKTRDGRIAYRDGKEWIGLRLIKIELTH